MSIWELLRGNWQLVSSRMGGSALNKGNGKIPTLLLLKSGNPDCATGWLDLKELRSRYWYLWLTRSPFTYTPLFRSHWLPCLFFASA
ncbi:MAG: hypothetical protein KME31_03180 [Tolypothrix carrinoi HA7290-LM1]|nr:hypothetical protein [Tolypothrix carrinoi HA7290-LM1]